MTGWQTTVASAGYAALMAALLPINLLRLWWRGRAEPAYRQAIGERLGRYGGPRSSGWVWVHAVSLGETRAAAALIDALRAAMPGMRLLLTNGTATGREAAQALLHEGDAHVWLPYDTAWIVNRFFAHFSPRVGVLMETEVWPSLLSGAARAGVPVVLANARLSEKSRVKGERLKALLHPALQRLALVLAQTEQDAERFRASGATRVQVHGNLKFDVAPDASQQARGHAWRRLLQRPVLLAAITREGEERMVLDAWPHWPEPRPLLLIVPRHPQRFDEVAALVQGAGLSLARRSAWQGAGDAAPPPQALAAQVWLGDSMREMALYYACADVALLGGSFAPLGGHNLIEAAACACPVILGPHTYNFAQAADLAVAAGAAFRVADAQAGLAEARRLLGSGSRDEVSGAALRFASQHRGAAMRMAVAIAETARLR